MGIILTQGEIAKIDTNISNLETICSNLTKVENSLSEITENESLIGLSYKRLKTYCSQNFNPIINGFKTSQLDALKEINKNMKNDFTRVLSGYSKLDTSELPELNRRLKNLKNSLNAMYSKRKEWDSFEEQRYWNVKSTYDTVYALIQRLNELIKLDSDYSSKINGLTLSLEDNYKTIGNFPNWLQSDGKHHTFSDWYYEFMFNTNLDVEPIVMNRSFSTMFNEFEIVFINNYIKNASKDASGVRGKLVATAKSLVDIMNAYGYKVPYIMDGGNGKYPELGIFEDWGNGTKGLDCSGFVQWVFVNAGVPVSSALGTSLILEIAKLEGNDGALNIFSKNGNLQDIEYQIQPGDLLVNRGGSVGHTGIVTDVLYDDQGNIEKIIIAEERGHKGLIYTELDPNLGNYNSDEKSVWNYNTTSVINVDKLNNFDRGEGSKVIMAKENGQVESVTNEQVTERLEEIRGTSSSNDSDTNSKKNDDIKIAHI